MIRIASLLLTAITCTMLAAGEQSPAPTLTYKDLVKRLTDMELLAVLPPVGEHGALASSYDRASRYDAATDSYIKWAANDDGRGFIRQEGDGYVLAEIQGPGCIWRMWSAKTGGRSVKMYLDGAETPAVALPWMEYFSGKSEPFNRPNLVYKVAKGYNNYTPIPFQKSCKIVGERGFGVYFHFNYTSFAPGTVVPTFKLPLSAEDSASLDAANRILGQCGNDPSGQRPGQNAGTKKLTVPANGKAVVETLTGPQAITGLTVALPDLPRNLEEQRMLLAQLTVSITWDDDSTPAVWAPLGDFFASSAGAQPFQTLPTGLLEDGTFYCYWYMPFGSKAQIEVGNDSAKPVAMSWEVTRAPLMQPIAKLGRFHAKWHRDALLPERKDRQIDWTILTAQGQGRFVGTQLHIWNPRGGWWGEGDEKFFVDGEKFPSTIGTGAEDYFGYAWGDKSAFAKPMHSQPVHENHQGHISVNRWHIADNVPFQKTFEGDIEKYFPNSRGTLFAAVAYWYMQAGGKDPYPPVPVAERAGWWNMDIYMEPGAIEGEAMITGGTAHRCGVPEDMTRHGEKIWSRDQQLVWGDDVGEKINLVIPPFPERGRCRILARFTKGPGYGRFQLSFNQEKLGQPVDLYAAKFGPVDPVELGIVDVPADNKESILTLEALGRNADSKGGLFGLDYIKLVPVR